MRKVVTSTRPLNWRASSRTSPRGGTKPSGFTHSPPHPLHTCEPNPPQAGHVDSGGNRGPVPAK